MWLKPNKVSNCLREYFTEFLIWIPGDWLAENAPGRPALSLVSLCTALAYYSVFHVNFYYCWVQSFRPRDLKKYWFWHSWQNALGRPALDSVSLWAPLACFSGIVSQFVPCELLLLLSQYWVFAPGLVKRKYWFWHFWRPRDFSLLPLQKVRQLTETTSENDDFILIKCDWWKIKVLDGVANLWKRF